MATIAKKPVKRVSTTNSKAIASPKKRLNLSKKQWGILGISAVVLISAGTYFGVQYYQDVSPNAAGWTTVGTNSIGIKKKSYGTIKIYVCKKAKGSAYTITAKQVTTGLYGDRNAPDKGAMFYINNSQNGDRLAGGVKAVGPKGTSRTITTSKTVKSSNFIEVYSATEATSFDEKYYPSQGWSYKVSTIKNC